MTETDPTRDRARDGLDHLQAAARELIAAARAALDVAEGLIDDPEVVTAMASAAGRVGNLLRSVAPERPGRFTDWEDDAATAPDDSQVEHITID